MVETLKRGTRKAWFTYLDLVKIMVPVYIGVTFLEHTGIIEWIAQFAQPLMGYFGLPGEAVLSIVTGYLLNLYGAIGVAAGLELTAKELTILGTMLGLSHSLIIEAAVIKKVSNNLLPLVALRVGLSILAGLGLNLIL